MSWSMEASGLIWESLLEWFFQDSVAYTYSTYLVLDLLLMKDRWIRMAFQ